MTLVQACIADKGDCVILIADRLLTSTLSEDLPSYEFESNTPKIIHKGNIVGVGFAGSSLYADLATSKIDDKEDFDEITKVLSDFIKKEKDGVINSFIKRLTGVESKDFFTNSGLPIPQDVRDYIYGKLHKIDLDFQCVIAGFDKKGKARTAIIDQNGDIAETTNFNAACIGSGSPFANIYFDQYCYNLCMVVNEALLFAYEAKKWAQSHEGVGAKTDILTFRKNKTVLEIYDKSELIEKMNKKFEEEAERHINSRRNLLDGIIK